MLVAAGALLIAVSVALAGANVTFVEYPAFLIGSLRWQDEYGIDRAHMYGWLGFFGSVLPLSRDVALPLSLAASLATLAAALWVSRRDQASPRPLLALAIASILISPHLHAQDLQLLLVPLLIASRRDLTILGLPLLLVLTMPSNIVAVAIAPPVLAAALAYVVATRDEDGLVRALVERRV